MKSLEVLELAAVLVVVVVVGILPETGEAAFSSSSSSSGWRLQQHPQQPSAFTSTRIHPIIGPSSSSRQQIIHNSWRRRGGSRFSTTRRYVRFSFVFNHNAFATRRKRGDKNETSQVPEKEEKPPDREDEEEETDSTSCPTSSSSESRSTSNNNSQEGATEADLVGNSGIDQEYYNLQTTSNSTNPSSSGEENTRSIDIFSPSLLIDDSISSSSSSSSDITTAASTNQTVINGATTIPPILNEAQLREALEVLGPMTMSDPSFAIGAGVNVTMMNASDISSSPSLAKGNNNNTANKKNSYMSPFFLIDADKLFSYTGLKLPTYVKNGQSNRSSNATNNATAAAAAAPTIAFASFLNTTGATSNTTSQSVGGRQSLSSNNSAANLNYYLVDPTSALASLAESQENFTKQQMEAAQKVFLDYSAQLDLAQKALLEYGTKAAQNQKALLDYGTKALEETVEAAAASATSWSSGSPPGTIGVDELEAYLRLNGYVKQADLGLEGGKEEESLLPSSKQVGRRLGGRGLLEGVSDDTRKDQEVSKKATKSSRVAFPQPSILSYSNLKWGSTAAASVLGLIGGITIFPNLWLLGSLFGGLYGYDVSKNLAEKPPTSALAKAVVYLGRELTKKYLWVYDFCAGLWFMYKTGQLSYDYWKKYAALDQQFAIQAKMDAWNARFQKGKENFDKWEQENEVGRKILAGLRTAWLVEEKSKRKFGPKSRYRVVQWCFDAGQYTRRRIIALYAKRGKAVKEIQHLAEGMRQELLDPSQWSTTVRPRIAAALAALTFVNLTGALFAVSPLLLGFVAVVLGGIVWPTWFSEWLSRVGTFFEETKAKGRGELFRSNSGINSRNIPKRGTPKRTKSLPPNDKPKVLAIPFFMSKEERERYHYFQRPDGSKRWYRTGGNPWDGNSNLSNIPVWGKKKEEEKPWWSLN